MCLSQGKDEKENFFFASRTFFLLFSFCQADFADGEAKPEMLAIRFSNADNAAKFKAKVGCSGLQ